MSDKKKVFLVNPPADVIVLRDMYSSTISKGLYNWPPADLLVTSGILRDHCDVILKDANTEGLTHDQTIKEISDFKPDVVFSAFGNSVRDNDYAFLKKLKEELPKVRIIGSGGILLQNGREELDKHKFVDAICLNFATKDTLQYVNENYDSLHNYMCLIN
ncbi:cobalamin B12-binding domain-containing protein, partial [bacterium]|nr:cobalamin B12-binding domain-containing protein [bacterium]